MAIDTLNFARRLEAAGASAKQAEAEAEAIQEALETGTATKGDVAELRGEIATLKRMASFDLALTAAILAKLLIID